MRIVRSVAQEVGLKTSPLDIGAWFTAAKVQLDWLRPQDLNSIILSLVIGGLVVSLMALALQNRRLHQNVKRCQRGEADGRAAAAHYQALLQALPALMMRINRAGVYLEILALPDYPILGGATNMVGTHITDRLPPDIAQKRLTAIQKALVTQTVEIYEHTISVNGCLHVEQVSVIPHGEEEVLLLVQDINDRIKIEEQLKYEALHDKLTGLPNRSLLLERLELALKRTKRHPEIQLAVLFLDLDNFKVVNDSLGHLVGDKLLLAISEKLKLVIRETDLAARLGGDEFIVLLDEISDLSEAIMVAGRILDVLQSPINLDGCELLPGVSIGISTSQQNHGYTAYELLRDADVAMYWAKRRGRGQYAVFDASMHLQVVTRLQNENNLRSALENQEFLLYYQPIVNLNTQRIEAFEALLRWQHPHEGVLLPERFIDIAQEIGLLNPIAEWVWRTVCRQLVCWQTLFPDYSLKINVNFLGEQLKESYVLKLEEILASHGPVANRLMLEISESVLVQDREMAQRLLTRLKVLGVGVVVDDFGLGHSCLRYLHQLPVQALKLDQGFINPVELGEFNQIIAESIISLCKSLGLRTIAAGTTAQQQLSCLLEIGCDAVQGECFAKPMDVEEATELLRQEILDDAILFDSAKPSN